MAKFRKLLIGGIVGAAAAIVLSRKEVRKMLMGAGRKALPAAPETGPGYGTYEETTSAVPSSAEMAVDEATDFGTMIAETREKVEEHVESFGAPAVVEEAPVEEIAVEEKGVAEVPAEEMAVEEAAVVEAPTAEQEPAVEAMEAPEAEPPVAEAASVAEMPPAGMPEVAEPGPSAAVEALAEEAAWVEVPPTEEAPPSGPVITPRMPELIQEAPYIEPEPPAVAEPEAAAPEKLPAQAAEEQPVEEPEPAAEAPYDILGSGRGRGMTEWESLQFPAAGEPVGREPSAAAEPQAPTPPAAGETPGPTGIDRDEMRRRIDETRSRLKAKAFDAMMSGETFLDETEAEKTQPHTEAAPGIDAEVEKSIDESLRESD